MLNIDTESAKRLLHDAYWRKGQIARFKLRSSLQRDVHSFFGSKEEEDLIVAVCRRQCGKSFSAATYAVEQALKRPGIRILILMPTAKSLVEALIPTMEIILADCPKDIAPEYKVQERKYVFKNASTISLEGTDGQADQRLRGRNATLILVDEAGFHGDLEHLIKSILTPMISTTRGRLIVFSTPPDSPGHYFVKLAAEAEVDGNLIVRDIDQDDWVTPKMRASQAKLMGGEESPAFQREQKCQMEIADPEKAVLPEFALKEIQTAIVSKEPAPAPDRYLWRLTMMDIGYTHATHVVFAYYDFLNARLVLQGEVSLRRSRTDEIARAIRQKEKELWGKIPMVPGDDGEPEERIYRIADNSDPRLLSDLAYGKNGEPGIYFQGVRKTTLEAMINQTRQWIKDRRLSIHNCPRLVKQMKSAIWNKDRSKIAEDSEGTHNDAVMALTYGIVGAKAIFSENPFPGIHETYNPQTHVLCHSGEDEAQTDDDSAWVTEIFNNR